MEIPTSALPSFDDGTISDWLDVVPESLLMTDFHSLSGGKLSFPAEIDPKDFTFRIFLAWHYGKPNVFWLPSAEWMTTTSTMSPIHPAAKNGMLQESETW